jgi:hypothetical protein
MTGPDTFKMLRDWPNASNAFERAVKLEPEFNEPWIGLAYL